MTHAQQHARRGGQQGVTLIIALIMLMVIGLASAAMMRGALNADVMSNNSRLQTLANQAAQLALRFCETQVETAQKDWQGGFTIHDAVSPQLWTNFDNWEGGTAIAVTVPGSVMKSDNSSFSPSKMPQCLAEYRTDLGGSMRVVVVTARGFSPDYAQTDAGRQTSGSVVWLQSTLRVN